jgi:iron-sulfur cluster repair protein YtfE (RIC family)
MLLSRILLYFLIIILLISYCCEAQQEIRKAVRAKTNRKIKEGKKKIHQGQQAVQRVKNQAKAPFDRAGAKINGKYQNTRRKIEAIENIIQS